MCMADSEHASREAGRRARGLAASLHDVRGAADVFRPVFESTGGDDGFVSIEVGPQFARDTQGSIAEARRLWSACDRPNVMVKIPATPEGLPSVQRMIGWMKKLFT